MTTEKGFIPLTVLLAGVGIVVLGLGAYAFLHPELLQKPSAPTSGEDAIEAQAISEDSPEGSRSASEEASIMWRLADAGETDGMPHTKVTALVNGTAYEVGTFAGSCSEIGAGGGIDGKGFLAGELSAVQCWFAGSGDEIGIFAHEDGGFDILTGALAEGEAGSALFRGDFTVWQSVPRWP